MSTDGYPSPGATRSLLLLLWVLQHALKCESLEPLKKRTGNPRYHLCPHRSHKITFSGVCFCRDLSPAEAKLFRNNLCSRKEMKLKWIPWREIQNQWSRKRFTVFHLPLNTKWLRKNRVWGKVVPRSVLGFRRESYRERLKLHFSLMCCSTQNDPAKENVPWHWDFMISGLLRNKCLVLEAINFHSVAPGPVLALIKPWILKTESVTAPLAALIPVMAGLSEGFLLLIFFLDMLLWKWKHACQWQYWRIPTFPGMIFKNNKSFGAYMYSIRCLLWAVADWWWCRYFHLLSSDGR